ncbi:MAG: HD domain-containing protein [Candidatus Burarchaeum sp.]|nr:HD domain-containing protein [Candidatus Burarchaeum sp.]MDO8339927.1 HD domain-containing protein [Candidatus Burarchaeum sp.]
MVVVKDAVHGNIKVGELERRLMDTAELQRLRGVKQLGMTYLVYPGANHTRFEHALGTMHITGQFCEAMGLGQAETARLRAAALLHDVGHLAFSHESEAAFAKILGGGHEELGARRILKGEIAEVLTDAGISPREIVALMMGRGKGQVIAGDVGADRIDYLLRDAHYTGVAYGVIDAQRIIHTARLGKEGSAGKAGAGKRGAQETLVLQWGGLEAAESLLIARYLMFSTVYMHHAVRIAASMLRRAMERAFDEKLLGTEMALELDDASMMAILGEDGKAAELSQRVQSRRLYKRAAVLWWSRMRPKGQRIFTSRKGCGEMEKKLEQKAGLGADDVIIDVCEDYGKGSSVRILMEDGKVVPLAEVSAIVNSISLAEQRRWRAIVACDEANVEKVKKASKTSFKGLAGSQ